MDSTRRGFIGHFFAAIAAVFSRKRPPSAQPSPDSWPQWKSVADCRPKFGEDQFGPKLLCVEAHVLPNWGNMQETVVSVVCIGNFVEELDGGKNAKWSVRFPDSSNRGYQKIEFGRVTHWAELPRTPDA